MEERKFGGRTLDEWLGVPYEGIPDLIAEIRRLETRICCAAETIRSAAVIVREDQAMMAGLRKHNEELLAANEKVRTEGAREALLEAIRHATTFYGGKAEYVSVDTIRALEAALEDLPEDLPVEHDRTGEPSNA